MLRRIAHVSPCHGKLLKYPTKGENCTKALWKDEVAYASSEGWQIAQRPLFGGKLQITPVAGKFTEIPPCQGKLGNLQKSPVKVKKLQKRTLERTGNAKKSLGRHKGQSFGEVTYITCK
ncbi:hypothetical protein Taro_040917 [Colocasia esculenta]|uniref:Uncharacterized protein n=1 Tax=Colocasia esculenta TaxID=4460 RepID=A0A843WK37_COLES|nr:hypothetical protein [Colocasia esculenta]